MTNSKISGFVPELESLRGLAAFSVLVEHCYMYTVSPEPDWFAKNPGLQTVFHWLIHVVFDGRAAVFLFFVLSGFVLSVQLEGQIAGPVRSTLAFAIRRIFRLVPVTVISILFAYASAKLFGVAESSPGILLKNLLFESSSLNPPIWTVYFELICSLFFPLLYVLSRLLPFFWRVSVVAPLFLMTLFPGLPLFLHFLVFFYLGLLARRDGAAFLLRIGRHAAQALLISALLLYGIAPQLWAFKILGIQYADARLWYILEMPATFMIVCYVANVRKGLSGSLLRNRFARELGKISFSLYAFHYLLVQLLWPFVIINTVTVAGYPLLRSTVLFLVVTPCALVAAFMGHRLLELPTNRLGRNIASAINDVRPPPEHWPPVGKDAAAAD